MSNIREVLVSYDRTAKQIIQGIVDGLSDYLDDVGIYVASRFNSAGQLSIRSGDLTRSMVGRKGAIRSVKVMLGRVIGEIGTSVTSKDGFSYPTHHEFGRYPFLEPAIKATLHKLISNIEKRVNSVI